MQFIDKLIEETKNSKLDFVWQYTQGNKYKYHADKHPLTNLTFSLDDVVTKTVTKDSGKPKMVSDNTKGIIIFPNGAGMEVDRSKLEELNQECASAILRAMDILARDYSNGQMQADIEAQKAAEQKNKEAKTQEKPTDEKQANKLKV